MSRELLDELFYNEYMIGPLIAVLVIWIGAAVGLSFIPANMAKKKGYSFGAFYCLSFFVSFVVTIIIAAVIKDKNPPPQYALPYGQPYPPYPPYAQGYPPPYGQPYPPYGQLPPPYGPLPVQPAHPCPACGAALAGDDPFCPKCGARVKES